MQKEIEVISSSANKKIKNIGLLLHKASERRTQQLTVVEGEKEITQALLAGMEVESVFVCREIVTNEALLQQCFKKCAPQQQFYITPDVFKKIAYRDDSGGIVILIKPNYHSFDTLVLPENPLIVILENVEKPGNLGAVLRTCDAAAVDLLIICNPNTDIYNPNVIRSGIGCVFTKKIISCTSDDALHWLKTTNIKILAAALQTEKFYHQCNFMGGTALVFGTEAEGLTKKWIQQADAIIKIPMMGSIDSLNVSNAVAIMVYEACRQRNFDRAQGKGIGKSERE